MQQGEKIFWSAAAAYLLYGVYQHSKQSASVGLGFPAFIPDGKVFVPAPPAVRTPNDLSIQTAVTTFQPTAQEIALFGPGSGGASSLPHDNGQRTTPQQAAALAQKLDKMLAHAPETELTGVKGYAKYLGPGQYEYSLTPGPGFYEAVIPAQSVGLSGDDFGW